MAALRSIPTSATELIFGPQNQEKSQDKSADKPTDEVKKEIEPKEFFWDQLILYVATIIALLTLLDISLQLLRSGGLFCYIPSGNGLNMSIEVTRDQAAFINNYCLQSLSLSEYYTVFILIQGIALAAPHYLWWSLFRGQFDFFFDLVQQLDRLRDSNIGEYRPANFELVKKLEKEFPSKSRRLGIFLFYKGKIALQLAVAAVSIIVNISVFPRSDFSFIFECPEDFNSASPPEGWLLPVSVYCVYASFRVFINLQYADYVLLVVAIGTAAYGMFWCFRRHINALGYQEAARFAFVTGLKADEYMFVYEPFWKSPFLPRIQSDLDFLLMRLFRADTGHGQVFRDILVDKDIGRQVRSDHERLCIYLEAIKDGNVKKHARMQLESHENRNGSGPAAIQSHDTRKIDINAEFYEAGFSTHPEDKVYRLLGTAGLGNIRLERTSGIRDQLFGFFQFAPDNGMAYDISFGTTGYSLILARAFGEVLSVNFSPFYQPENREKLLKKETFLTNDINITLPDAIFSQKTKNINEFDRAIDEVFEDPGENPGDPPVQNTEKKIHFVIVGPFTDEAKITTANLHIERLNKPYFAEHARLLAIRPLKIGSRDVSEHFQKYEPPGGLFRKDDRARAKVRKELSRKKLDNVNGVEGIHITCESTECVFEFTVYERFGEVEIFEEQMLQGEEGDHASSDGLDSQSHSPEVPSNQRRTGAEVHQQLPNSTVPPNVNGHTVQASTTHQPDNESSLV